MTLPPHMDAAAVVARLAAAPREFQAAYLAMYSSWFGGIVTDPGLMLVPLDDHMVHRGDAVFEGFKCVAGAIYNLETHWDRLEVSARAIRLAWPMPRADLTEVVKAVVRAGKDPEALVRVYLSRGPGSFDTNPRSSVAPQAYVVATRGVPPTMQRFPGGVALRTSALPPKPPPYPTIKSCNYLPNALMKLEAVEAGDQYPVGFDARGYLAEGSTENIGVVTPDRRLLFPRPGRILDGTTMRRALALAGTLVAEGVLAKAGVADISRAVLSGAAEVLVCSTTCDIASAVRLDQRAIGAGAPGPVALRLNALLQDDMRSNPALRTPVFEAASGAGA